MTFLKPFLCEYCQCILKGPIDTGIRSDISSRRASPPHRALSEVKKQADKGCYICYHVWARFTAFIQDQENHPPIPRILSGKNGQVSCRAVYDPPAGPKII